MDTYKVAISLAMASNHAQVLGALSQRLLHVHAQANQLVGGLNRVKTAIVGALSVTAGLGTLRVMQGMIDKGNELVRVQRNMAIAGASATQVQESYAKSWLLTSKYKNVGATEIMKMINDARGIFGDQHVATHEVEAIARSASFLRAYQGKDKGTASHEGLMREMNAALKSGELAGKITPEQMFQHVDMLTAMKVAYGDQVRISQYLTAQRAAGVSLRNTDDKFRYGIFPALVQENGPGAGVMLMTAYNKIVAGTGIKTDSAKAMMQLGILDPRKVEYDKNGRVKRVGMDGIRGAREFATNPAEWVDKILRPALDKMTKDPIRQAQWISKIFPDRNAAKAVTEMLQQWPKLLKDAALVFKAYEGVQGRGTQNYTEGSYDYQLAAFRTQWDNLVTALGSSMVPQATRTLAYLNETLSDMAQWAGAKENAGTITQVAKGIAVFAGATVAAGAVAILAALGPAGWLILGIGALAGALTAARRSEIEMGPRSFSDANPKVKGFTSSEVDRRPWTFADDLQRIRNLLNTKMTDRDYLTEAVGKIQDFLKYRVDTDGLLTSLGNFSRGLSEWTASFGAGAKTVWGEMVVEVQTWPNRVGAAISEMGDTITSKIKGIFEGVKAWLKSWLPNAGDGSDSGMDGAPVLKPQNNSYQGGGLKGLIQKASASSAGRITGGANDNQTAGAFVPFAGGRDPAGMRNNNPGNIKYTGRGAFGGVVGPSRNTDQGDHQAVFDTADSGMRAAVALARRKFRGGRTTVNALIAARGGWTPGNFKAASNIARAMGVSPTQPIDLDDPGQMHRFMRGLLMQEHGPASRKYDDGMIERAIDGRRRIAPPPPPSSTPASEEVILVMDGERVGRAVSKRQVAQLNRPNHGAEYADYTSTFPQVA